jgi:hypothetical protein
MIAKIILSAWFATIAVVAIYNAGRGQHETTVTPMGQSLSAVLWSFLIAVLWLWT